MTVATSSSSRTPSVPQLHVFEDADAAWRDLLADLVRAGQPTSPRGRPTRELLARRTTFAMARPLVTSRARKLGYRFLAAEAAWILSGDDRVATIAPYSQAISRFSDDGETFFGAYGPRLVAQLDPAVTALRRDPDTRQAVVSLWRVNPPATRDVPCTLSLQLLVRQDRLHVIATMRSSDAWLGWPYDVHTFTMVAVAALADLPARYRLGTLTLTAGSQHLYADDLPGAMAVLAHGDGPAFSYADLDPTEFADRADLATHLWKVAERRPLGQRWLQETCR